MATFIVVDLDGTLTPADTLVESCIQFCKQHPLDLFKLPFWLLKGRAFFKAKIAQKINLSVELLPYHLELLEYLRYQKMLGRRLILATAAHSSIANAVAEHLDLFELVLSSDENRNLKGTNKLQEIQKTVGQDFVYVGDSKADIPIWQAAKAAIFVNTSAKISKTISKSTPIEHEFCLKNSLKVWIKALRMHQWLKNLLLFVPILTAFAFEDFQKNWDVFFAFVAFSLSASATYIGNDLWDLNNDRAHPRKKHRAFASARIPALNGFVAALALLTTGLIIASTISLHFFTVLLAYLVITISYTLILKAIVLIDVLILAILYTLRIIGGAIAAQVSISSWLLAFSVFLFFSLALVKRCSELVSLQQRGHTITHGRDYRSCDLAVLWPLGVSASLSAVVVFGMFISAPDTQSRYATYQGLWLVALGLIYWLSRLWIKTARGEMHDDPIIFTARDFGSQMLILGMICIMLISHFFTLK